MENLSEIKKMHFDLFLQKYCYENCLTKIENNIRYIEKMKSDCCLHNKPLYNKISQYAEKKLRTRIIKQVEKLKKNTVKITEQNNPKELLKMLKKKNNSKNYEYLDKLVDFYSDAKHESYGYFEATKFYENVFRSFEYLLKELINDSQYLIDYIEAHYVDVEQCNEKE